MITTLETKRIIESANALADRIKEQRRALADKSITCSLRDREAEENEKIRLAKLSMDTDKVVILCESPAVARILYADSEINTYLCARHRDVMLDALLIKHEMALLLHLDETGGETDD